MKRLIHKYLSDYYKVKGQVIILLRDYDELRDDYVPFLCVNSVALIADLELVFDFTKKELKWIVKSWIHKQNKGFGFNVYWNPPPLHFGNITFPMTRRVQRGMLFYLDHHVGNPVMGIDIANNNNNNNNNNNSNNVAIGQHAMWANTTGSGMSRRHGTPIIDEPNPQWGYLNTYLENKYLPDSKTLASKLSMMTKYYGNLNLVNP